jgi:hypothetical protein
MRLAAQLIASMLAPIPALSRAQNDSMTIPASGVTGVQDAMLSPDDWMTELASPDRALLTRAQIDCIDAMTGIAAIRP